MLFFKKIVSTNRQGAELHFWRWVEDHILCSKTHKQKCGSSAKRNPLFYTHQNKAERHPNGFLYPWGCLLSYCVFALCRLPQPAISLCFFWFDGHKAIRRYGVWITLKNFFENLSPNLEVGASATVVVAKGEDKYHPPLRTRREVRKWNLIRTKNTSSIPLMRSVKR